MVVGGPGLLLSVRVQAGGWDGWRALSLSSGPGQTGWGRQVGGPRKLVLAPSGRALGRGL